MASAQIPGDDPAVSRDAVVQRIFSLARTLIRIGYFSFEVEGIERVPRAGRVVYAQNHSGWFPLDAFAVTFAIAEAHGLERAPCFATHESALASPLLGPFLRKFGAVPATWFRRPERLPPEVESCGIFPEGVRGNCKPFWEAYRMRNWNRGFVRVAIARQSPIVPVAIFGGEECLPVAWTVKFLEPLIGSILGLPLTLLPLPARWKVIFHEPIELHASKEAITDQGYCSDVARRIQGIVQQTLDAEAARRPLGRLSSLVAAAKKGPVVGEVEDPLADPVPPSGEVSGGVPGAPPGSMAT
jgi:1-acyl-sn-glycerol-3-phosphate acyltransferase